MLRKLLYLLTAMVALTTIANIVAAGLPKSAFAQHSAFCNDFCWSTCNRHGWHSQRCEDCNVSCEWRERGREKSFCEKCRESGEIDYAPDCMRKCMPRGTITPKVTPVQWGAREERTRCYDIYKACIAGCEEIDNTGAYIACLRECQIDYQNCRR